MTEIKGVMYHLPDGKRYYALQYRSPNASRFKANAEALALLYQEKSMFCWAVTLLVNGVSVWQGTREDMKILPGRRHPGVIHYFLCAP